MKVLGPNDIGIRGFLIEYDSGFISPNDLKNKQIITEMKNLDFMQDLILYAVLQKYDIPNKNGRIYPEAVLRRENDKYQLLIKNGGAINELNHPTSSLIDLDRVSHSILETWWEGNALLGKLKIFTSPGWKKSGIISCKGDQAANLLMNGATLGISSRGVGSLKNVKGQNIVQDDFELVCFDLVSSPSTPGAYIFSDLEDRGQYEESVQERPEESNKITSLMSRLDNFLSK
jgi:Prohead core protein serine protease